MGLSSRMLHPSDWISTDSAQLWGAWGSWEMFPDVWSIHGLGWTLWKLSSPVETKGFSPGSLHRWGCIPSSVEHWAFPFLMLTGEVRHV
jgi:hypothetical protein